MYKTEDYTDSYINFLFRTLSLTLSRASTANPSHTNHIIFIYNSCLRKRVNGTIYA